MTDPTVVVTNVIVAAEVAAAGVLAIINYREMRFLERLAPLRTADEDLPLYGALMFRARYITWVVVYFLAITALGALGVQLGELFPPIRAINGALLLGLMAGPRIVGDALRRRARHTTGADT